MGEDVWPSKSLTGSREAADGRNNRRGLREGWTSEDRIEHPFLARVQYFGRHLVAGRVRPVLLRRRFIACCVSRIKVRDDRGARLMFIARARDAYLRMRCEWTTLKGVLPPTLRGCARNEKSIELFLAFESSHQSFHGFQY